MTTSKKIRRKKKKVCTKKRIFEEKELELPRKAEELSLDEYPFITKDLSKQEKQILVLKGIGETYDSICKRLKVGKNTISKCLTSHTKDLENIKNFHLNQVSESYGVTRGNLFLFNSAMLNKVGVSLQKDILEGSAIDDLSLKEKWKLFNQLKELHEHFTERNKIHTGKFKSPYEGAGLMEEKDMDL